MHTQTYNPRDWSEVVLLTFVYALYIFFVTAPVGAIVSAYKVYRFTRLAEQSAAPLSQETVLLATHHEWLVSTFLFAVVMAMVALGTLYYMVGFVVAGIEATWWFYRLIRGAAALVAHRNMPATICSKIQCYGQVTHV